MKRLYAFAKSSRIGLIVFLFGIFLSILGLVLESTFPDSFLRESLAVGLVGLGTCLVAGGLTFVAYKALSDRMRRADSFAKHSRRMAGDSIARLESNVQRLATSISLEQERSQESVRLLGEEMREGSIQLRKDLILRFFNVADQMDTSRGLLSRQELTLVAKDVTLLPPLLVAWIYDANECLDVLPLSEKRRLCSYTRLSGYWSLSQSLLKSIVSETGSQRDIKAFRSRESELEVFSGRTRLACTGDPEGFLPVQGHILHVVGKSLPNTQTGYTLRTHYTALAQRKLGYHVSVVAMIGESDSLFDIKGDIVDDIQYFGLPGAVRSEWLLAEWLQANVNHLAELVASIRPAVLHAHSDFLNAMVATTVARHFNIPVVYESRGFWEESWISRTAQTLGIDDWAEAGRHLGLPNAYKLRQEMEKTSRLEADHVVTLAKVMKEHIVALGGHEDKVTIIPNAVNSELFPVTDRDMKLCDNLGIPRDSLIIGYISSIVEYEGIDTLIRAFHHEADAALREAHLLIVGDGAQLAFLKQLVENLEMSRVHFTGRVDHELVLSYYSLMDIFVVPRRPVNVCQLVTPLKPFEAFSSGRTVLMSDVAALREIAEDSDSARLFVAGDHISLARELVNLVSNPKEREKMGMAAAEWVRENRSWDKNATVYDDVYKGLGIDRYGSFSTAVPALEGGYDIDSLRRWISHRDTSEYLRWFDVDSGASADDVMSRGWLLTGFEHVDLSLPIDWEICCSSNRSWAFHLHTWEFMDPVVREFAKTGRRELLVWCLDRALSWIHDYVLSSKNGPESMAWYDMSLGLRSPRLMALISMAVEEGCGQEILRDLVDGALRHRLEHDLERSFNPRTNHGYYAAVGQTVLGQGLRPLPGMLQLEEQGTKRLRVMAATQFKVDGVHSEHSPDYHRMVLDSFKLGIEQGLITDEVVIDRITKAAGAMGWMIRPDGRLVQFGDSPERVMTSSRMPLTSNEHTNFLMSRGQIGVPNKQTLAVFPDAGYAFVRDPQPSSVDDHESSAYLAFSAAFHSRAHKHADDLNFVWSDYGQEILVDAGRFGYGDLLPPHDPKRLEGYYYGAPERQYVESTIAHNTVAIDGENHERRTRAPYGSGLQECIQRPDCYELTAEAPHGHWNHRRRLSMAPRNWLVIEDHVQSLDGKVHDFRSWFNLPGELTVEFHDDLTLRVDGGKLPVPLWIRGWGDLELVVPVSGQEQPLRGWRSLKDRSLEPTWSLGYSLNQESEGLITVLFNFGEEPLEYDPRVE